VKVAIRITAALAAASLAFVAGCGSSKDSGGGSSSAAASGPVVNGTVTVFAAASLTETFTALGKKFEAAHKGVTVKLSFAGSDALAAQINQAAPADVFAAASDKTMKLVTDAGNGVGTPTIFAKNQLEIAVPADNPAKITSLADLAKPTVKLGLCAATVPCGAAATTVFTVAALTVKPVTLETDVKSLLTKVQLGEVDAGLVYKTDVASGGTKIKGIEFPESAKAITNYPIIVVKNAPNSTGAAAFLAYITGPIGQAALTAAGFAKP
jgi:molybdate transport system substrate-binding protein